MITITINFSSSKILCGLSMMYQLQSNQLETAADFQQRGQISGISSPSYFQFRPEKQLLCSFLPKNCSKHALVGSWLVSGADQQYDEYILLKFEIYTHVADFFCHFECQFLHIHLQDNLFTFFSCFSQKVNINFAYFNKNQHALVLRYVLVILSRFENTLQTTNSKLTNEKTNYNEL